jgi:heme-degrading monooxygenase HmoA
MYAWMTARRIRPGTMEQFRSAWEVQREKIPGLLNVYFLQDDHDPNRMIGLAIWENEDAFDRYASTLDETNRKQAMIPYVEDVEWQRFFQVVEVI